MKPNTLAHIAYFLSKKPITGLNTINNLLRITKKRIPIDAPFISFFTHMILKRELNMLFSRLRKEDMFIGMEKIEDYSEEELDKICFDRGINID